MKPWLFIAYSDERLCYQILIATLICFSIKGWKNVLFELGSGRINWQLREQLLVRMSANWKLSLVIIIIIIIFIYTARV